MHKKRALITGASEGLGKSFAIELASRGIDLVLVSLADSGLFWLSTFLKRNFDVDVETLELDLTAAGSCSKVYESLRRKNITINILINNAGVGNLSFFEDKSESFYQRQIELNTLTPVTMTRLFLAQVDRSRQNYILNVGSLGGVFMVPRKQVYGATKSFIRYFTKCLRFEMKGTSVSVTLLSPGGIDTKPELLIFNAKLKGIARATILAPETVANIAIEGMFKGRMEIIPGRLNRLLVVLNSLFPENLKNWIITRQLHLNN